MSFKSISKHARPRLASSRRAATEHLAGARSTVIRHRYRPLDRTTTPTSGFYATGSGRALKNYPSTQDF